MAIERHFLGWDEPALTAAVRWLGERYAPRDRWELDGVTVVAPTAEAGRRLLQRLVDAAGDALLPPELVTPGTLPELLYEPAGDASPTVAGVAGVAGELEARLARIAALQAVGADLLSVLAPGQRPGAGDFAAWWTLAGQLEHVASELAAGGLTPGQVLARVAGLDLPPTAEQRWEAIGALEQAYHERLRARGLVDRDAARLAAVASGGSGGSGGGGFRISDFGGGDSPREWVLLGLADLPALHQRMLRGVAGGTGVGAVTVHALIHAPAAHAEGFNDVGVLDAAYWGEQRVELAEEQIHFEDRPADQARAVVAQLAAAGVAGVGTDAITVGLGDERQVGPVRRAIELAGVATRYAAGGSVGQTRPVLLLDALARFADGQRFDAFAALLRHPDMERYVGAPREAIRHWLTLLDRYAGDRLQGRLDGRWLGDGPEQRRLKTVWDRVQALMPDGANRRLPLPDWSEPIAGILDGVYGQLELTRHSPHDEPMIRSLQALATALREQARVDGAEGEVVGDIPQLTLSQAIALTAERVRDQRVPEPGGRDAVELMGYLELAVDDAPQLVIASMNDGAVPASRNSDPLLPDRVRTKLGLADNAHRYGRDLLALMAMTHSKRELTLIACRRSADNEPLAPSRLLLACDDDALVARTRRFYKPANDDSESELRNLKSAPLLAAGDRTRFLIPYPTLDESLPRRLHVTAFRDYLACPYRFYLRHVRKLDTLDDRLVEMDGRLFGIVAHEVLERFAKSELAASTRADEIADYLVAELERVVADRFGGAIRAALRIQAAHLERRLQAFASVQATRVRDGWRICPEHVEQRRELVLETPAYDDPFTIIGKADRIDFHEQLGYEILDYKTGDTARRPDQTHRQRGQWVDLQLPLYIDLYGPALGDAPLRTGYVNLPKDPTAVGMAGADWDADELDEARACRDEVIAKLRSGIYWPPSEQPPAWTDGLEHICGDTMADRPGLIKASETPT